MDNPGNGIGLFAFRAKQAPSMIGLVTPGRLPSESLEGRDPSSTVFRKYDVDGRASTDLARLESFAAGAHVPAVPN